LALDCRLLWELVCKLVLELLSGWEENKIEETILDKSEREKLREKTS